MINYYLLKGQSEFLHVKQKQLPCLVKVCACAFWLIAGQVTQHNKWHAWSGDTCQSSHSLNVCHLFPPMLEVLFSFPTQLALFFSRFPSPYFKFSRHKCVWHKCVSWTSVPLHLHCRCYIQVLTTNIYIQVYLQVSRLCIAKPTAWKRGCGKVRSTPFPHYQKESVAVLAIFESLFES